MKTRAASALALLATILLNPGAGANAEMEELTVSVSGSDGLPVSDATIRVTSALGAEVTRVTDADGTASFHLSSGIYRIDSSAPSRPVSHDFVLLDGPRTIDVTLAPAVVTHPVDLQILEAGSGTPVPGAVVALNGEAFLNIDLSERLVVNRDGRAQVSLPGGKYLLTASLPPFFNSTTREVEIAGPTHVVVNLMQSRGDLIPWHGRIEEGQMRHAVLVLLPKAGGSPTVVPIDGDGMFTAWASPGEYVAYAANPGNLTLVGSVPIPSTLESIPLSAIADRHPIFVVDDGGRPVSNATVVLEMPGFTMESRTDPNGRVALKLNAPQVIVRVSRLGYETTTASLSETEATTIRLRTLQAAAQSFVIDEDMRRKGALELLVIDSQNQIRSARLITDAIQLQVDAAHGPCLALLLGEGRRIIASSTAICGGDTIRLHEIDNQVPASREVHIEPRHHGAQLVVRGHDGIVTTALTADRIRIEGLPGRYELILFGEEIGASVHAFVLESGLPPMVVHPVATEFNPLNEAVLRQIFGVDASPTLAISSVEGSAQRTAGPGPVLAVMAVALTAFIARRGR